MNFFFSLVAVVIATSSQSAEAQRNVFGSCPAVTPMPEFDISKFAGRWYVIQLFDNRVACMEWNIVDNGGQWLIQETKTSGAIKAYNGRIFPDEQSTGNMRVSWSLNIGGSYPFIVHDTDYENYASLFLCQTVLFYTRQQGMILSRTPTLPVDIRQTLTGRLSSFGVEMTYFHRVQQSNCNRQPEDSGEEDQAPEGEDESTYIFEDIFGEFEDDAEPAI